MSIRPIDMQITIQKTDHYTKDFNNNSQVLNSQQDTSVETQRQVLQNQRQVISTQSSQNKRINRDESMDDRSGTKDNYSNSQKDDRHQKDRESISLIEDDKGAFVDITI